MAAGLSDGRVLVFDGRSEVDPATRQAEAGIHHLHEQGLDREDIRNALGLDPGISAATRDQAIFLLGQP